LVGITRIVDRTVELSLADLHIAEALDNTKIDGLKALIARQFFTSIGGPCEPRQPSVYAPTRISASPPSASTRWSRTAAGDGRGRYSVP
jgi:hypothetical protein